MNKSSGFRWISLNEILSIHEKLLALHGGAVGVRDLGLLESALASPANFLKYEDGSDLFDLASAYAYSIVNNHPFIDGNKRTGFIAAALFIEINGYIFKADEAAVVTMTVGLSDKSIGRKEYALWLREASSLI